MSLLTFLGMHNWSHTIAIFTFPCIYSRVSDFFPKGLLFIQDNMYMLNIGCPKLQTILLPRMYNTGTLCLRAFALALYWVLKAVFPDICKERAFTFFSSSYKSNFSSKYLRVTPLKYQCPPPSALYLHRLHQRTL